MKVLQFLQLPGLLLARGRLGWEAVGWSQSPLAELMKSPGQLLQSPGCLPKFPCRLLGLSSRIRLLQGEPAQIRNLTLAMV